MDRVALILDDDHGICRVLTSFLKMEGFSSIQSDTCEDALAQCAINHVDLVILDCNIGGGEIGWDCARHMRENPELYGTPVIIAVSGTVDIFAADLDMPEGRVDLLLQKPFDLAGLKAHIERMVPSGKTVESPG